jgi:hypothetical protein
MDKYDRPLATLDHNVLLSHKKIVSGAPDCTPKDVADAQALDGLLALNRQGKIRLMVSTMAMIENRRGDEELDLVALVEWLVSLGLDRGDVLTHPESMAFSVAGAPGVATYGPHLEMQFRQSVHAILFEGKVEPGARNIDFRWFDYRDHECARQGIVGSDREALLALDELWFKRGQIPAPRPPILDAFAPEKRSALQATLNSMRRIWTNAECDVEHVIIHLAHVQRTRVPHHAVFVTSDRNFTRQGKWDKLKALGFPGHIMEPAEALAYFRPLLAMRVAEAGESHQPIDGQPAARQTGGVDTCRLE